MFRKRISSLVPSVGVPAAVVYDGSERVLKNDAVHSRVTIPFDEQPRPMSVTTLVISQIPEYVDADVFRCDSQPGALGGKESESLPVCPLSSGLWTSQRH